MLKRIIGLIAQRIGQRLAEHPRAFLMALGGAIRYYENTIGDYPDSMKDKERWIREHERANKG